MHAFRSRRWPALAVAFGFTVPVAHAEWITPDSIPTPPSAVGSADGTSVLTSNLVTTQYAGMGLNFGEAAITSLNGTSVWAPIGIAGSNNPAFVGPIDYVWQIDGDFVSPGSSNPTTVSSLSIKIIGNAGVSIYGLNDQTLNITPVISSTAGAQIWTFTGPGISGFDVSPSYVASPPLADGGPWGVAGVSFTPASAPEPSSLVLAGLGALGLASRLGWRRIRQLA